MVFGTAPGCKVFMLQSKWAFKVSCLISFKFCKLATSKEMTRSVRWRICSFASVNRPWACLGAFWSILRRTLGHVHTE